MTAVEPTRERVEAYETALRCEGDSVACHAHRRIMSPAGCPLAVDAARVTAYAFMSTLPPEVHATTREQCAALPWATLAHEDVPMTILTDPVVQAGINFMLGPDAVFDGCAHIHGGSPTDGPWHVDDYCGQPWPGRFVILGYFPQDTTPEMGPTEIRADGRKIRTGGPAGSGFLIGQDVEHRVTANRSGLPRFMLKYLFRAAK